MLGGWNEVKISSRSTEQEHFESNGGSLARLETFCLHLISRKDNVPHKNWYTVYIHTVHIAGQSLLPLPLSANEVLQNLTGDCWLLAAIAGVAEFPSYFKEHVFVTQEAASQTVATTKVV